MSTTTEHLFRRAALIAAASLMLSPAATCHAAAATIGLGGGAAIWSIGRFDPQTAGPIWSIAVRTPTSRSASFFFRIGYEHFEIDEGLAVCLSTDCPSSATAVERLTSVPLNLGFRLSFHRAPPIKTRGFIELGPSFAWTQIKQGVVDEYGAGRTVEDLRSIYRWLPGLALGAGFERPMSDRVGVEWGVRFEVRNAPDRKDLYRPFDLQDGSFEIASLFVALTLSP